VAGYIENSLVMTLPGSRQGAKESLIAVLPALVHLFDVQKNVPHPGGYQ
jgi:molybdopterin biosynthesis enzyme MoaB